MFISNSDTTQSYASPLRSKSQNVQLVLLPGKVCVGVQSWSSLYDFCTIWSLKTLRKNNLETKRKGLVLEG